MRQKGVILIILGIFWISGHAGWTKTYGGAYDDVGYSVQETSDSGYIIGGWTMSFGAGEKDIYLIKTDAKGDTLWMKTYGGPRDDWTQSIKETSDSGYIITGTTKSFGAGMGDVYLIKTDANGDTLWTKTYGGSKDDYGLCVQETSDGGYIITGWTMSFGTGEYSVYLIKTDANGDALWTKTCSGIGRAIGFSVQEISDGGYIIGGWTMPLGMEKEDVYLIKTDVKGDTLWTKTYGGIGRDVGLSVQETSEDGYIIIGWTTSFGMGEGDVYIIKADAKGDTFWTKTYGGRKGNDQGSSVQETSDRSYIIAGRTWSFGAGEYDIYLIKTNAKGDTHWTKTYGGGNDDWSHSVQETSDGGYIIAGGTKSFSVGGSDVYLIKTNTKGDVGIAKRDPYPFSNASHLFHNRSEPFTSSTLISYFIPKTAWVTFSIYDISGKLVQVLSSGQESPGLHTINWNGRNNKGQNVCSGVYFLYLRVDNVHRIEKVVLIR